MTGNDNKKGEQPKTEVVNLHKEDYAVYIGRKGRGHDGTFGNPFDLRNFTREETIERYREYFMNRVKTDAIFREKVLELRGKKLGCFCKPRACHGDVIVDYLNSVSPTPKGANQNAIANRNEAKPTEEEIIESNKLHLRTLAMKMSGPTITIPMRTAEEKERELRLDRILRNKEDY